MSDKNPKQPTKSASSAFDTAAVASSSKNNNNNNKQQERTTNLNDTRRDRGRSFAAEFAQRSERKFGADSGNNNKATTPRNNNNNNNDDSASEPLNQAGQKSKKVPRTKGLHTHHFSAAELKKMDNFESVETWEPVTDLYLEYLSNTKSDNRYIAWLIYCVVGIAIGFWAIVVFHSIDQLNDIKMLSIAKILHEKTVGEAFVAHVFWSIGAAFFATITCYFYPNGSGGGVPEVMAQLNGIDMPEQVKAMVIAAKSVSVIFAVHSGMPVGAEGPMIQFGSIIGGLVSAGRSGSQTLNELLRPLYRTFQNPKDQRDFVTAGASAGVTSVFAAPIGGFLFVMEELASFMNPKVAWMTFTSCLCCYLFVQIGGTYLEGWQARDTVGTGTDIFIMNPDAVTLFPQNIDRQQYVPSTIISILPAIAVAVGLGLWAAGFIHLLLAILSKWRWVYINISAWRKCAEPVVLATLFNIIVFSIALGMPCKPIPAGFENEQLVNGVPEGSMTDASGKLLSSGSSSDVVASSSSSSSSFFVFPSDGFKDVSKKGTPFFGQAAHSHPLFGRFFSETNSWKKKRFNMQNQQQQQRAATSTKSLIDSASEVETNNNNNGTNPDGDNPNAVYYGGLRLHTAFCTENPKNSNVRPTHFSSFATLALSGSYNTIRLCLSRGTKDLLDVGAIALYFFLYSFGAAYCAGMFMASGIVIPTLIIGSLGGRLIGYSVTFPWGDPGVLALYGAAAFFSGLSRLTVSLVVIMVEISDDLENVPVMMIAVIVAKFVADALSHSLYHEQLQMRGVPFLDFDTQVHNLDKHCVADVMTPDPQCLPIVSSVSLLFKAAKAKYSGFPVVRRGIAKEDLKSTTHLLRRSENISEQQKPSDNAAVAGEKKSAVHGGSGDKADDNTELAPDEDFTFLGTISRDTCGRLLWHLYICEMNSATAEPPLPSYVNLQDIDDFYTEHVRNVGIRSKVDGSEFWLPPETTTFRDRLVDLSPFINSSAFFVGAEMSISRAYNLFRSMALRHLCVVDSANQLIGIIGRKNLLGHFLNENVKRKEEALLLEES